MSEFKASYLEIEPRELVHYLLTESGQQQREALNPANIIDLLKLKHVICDFDSEFPSDSFLIGGTPRAMLSFPDKLIASDKGLSDERMRFSVCHEVAHYVLPNHQYALHLCNSKGLRFSTQLVLEKEANEFAVDLLFMGDRFTLEANSEKISAGAVKRLSEKYKVSFEATARHLVERSFPPCMLVVFEREGDRSRIDSDLEQKWQVRYCISSPSFKARYFTSVQGSVPSDVVVQLTKTNVDIANSVHQEIPIKSFKFAAEFFSNNYSIFSFFIPI